MTFSLSDEEKAPLARDPATNRGYDTLPGGQALDGAVAYDRETEGKMLANLRSSKETADPDLKGESRSGSPATTFRRHMVSARLTLESRHRGVHDRVGNLR